MPEVEIIGDTGDCLIDLAVSAICHIDEGCLVVLAILIYEIETKPLQRKEEEE